MATAKKKAPSKANSTKENDALAALAQFANPEDTVQKINEKEERKGRRGGKFERLKDGETVVRFLPGVEDESFFYEANYHWMNNEVIFSRRDLGPGEDCPIGRYASYLWNKFQDTKDERYENQAKSLFAKQKYIYNAVIRGENGEPDRVVVLETGKSIKKELLDLINDSDVGDITDALKGRDIKITKSGSGLETRYKVKEKPQPSLLAGTMDDPKEAAKEIKKLLDQRKVLSEQIEYPTYDQAEQKLNAYRAIIEGKSPSVSEDEDYEEHEDLDEDTDAMKRLQESIKGL